MLMTLNPDDRIDLASARPALRHVRVGLGWTQADQPVGLFDRLLGRAHAIDLDAACLMLGQHGDLIDMVWFKKLRSLDDSVKHRGDSLAGDAAGPADDDESIDVDLRKLAASVHYLFFTVCSYTGHNFEDIPHAYCRLLDVGDNDDIARFELSRQGPHTGLIMASLSRHADGWTLQALGTPVNARTPDEMLGALQQWIQ